jgi:phosphoenolpyruvate carboxykinase (ATP)
VASRVPDLDGEDMDILQPRRLYERQGRRDEYQQIVERLKNERREYMQKWEGLNAEIARAVN